MHKFISVRLATAKLSQLNKTMNEKLTRQDFFACIRYNLKEIFSQKKGFIFVVAFFNTLSIPLLWLVQMAIPKIALDGLNERQDFIKLIISVAVFLIAEKVLLCINSGFKLLFNKTFLVIRTNEISKFHKKFLSVPYFYLEDSKFNDNIQSAYGSLLSYEGMQGLYHAMVNILSNLLTVIVILYFFANVNFVIIFISLFSIILSVIFSKHYAKLDFSLEEERAGSIRLKDYFNKLCFDYTYGKEIRIFSMFKMIVKYYNRAAEVYLKVLKKSEFYAFKLNAKNSLIAFVANAICFVFILKAFYSKSISMGDVVFYLGLLTCFSLTANALLNEFQNLIKASTKVYKYFLFMNTNYESKNSQSLSDNFEFSSLNFEGVSFSYKGNSKPALENLSFEIHKGDKIGIVGENGAGKSTLVKLLLRLYLPTKGRITLNGIDINEYAFEEYIKIISVVFQDVHVFAVSLLENITCDSDIDKEKLNKIINIARLNDYILKLPKYENTMLRKEIEDDGVTPSGGQQQKISFCRALYKDSEIYIFDEATASLDSLAEKDSVNSYNEYTKNKTSIFISHKLFHMKKMDYILFIHDGKLLEKGSHDELMKNKSHYCALFNKQSKYFKEEKAGENEDEEYDK